MVSRQPCRDGGGERGDRLDHRFQTRGAKKIGGRKGSDLYRIVPALKDILEKGKLTRTEQDTKGREELVEAWHTFAARVLLDGAEKDVIVKARKTAQGQYNLGC